MASQSSIARRARGGTSDDQAVLKAAARLTDRDRYLVRVVAEHRVLTTDQLAVLAFGNIITARHRLDSLARLGALNRFRPHRPTGSAPWHYLLGPLGAALLGAEDCDDKKWLPQVRAGRQVALQRSQRLAHMTGANWFFVSLAVQARRGGGELRTWLTRPNRTQEAAIDTTRLTISQLADLPATIDLMTAARILGIGRTKAYELARHGAFPCLVIRIGDLYRVSTADLLRLLGITTEQVHAPPTAA